MAPAAGGAAPARSAAAAAVAAPAIAGQEPTRAPPARRDLPGQAEGADPANAAVRKTAWGVVAPPPAAVAAGNPGSGIIGGDASWPALVESKPRSKSPSSDSLKSLSDSSGPSAQEDPIAVSVLPHPAVDAKPISAGSNPTTTLPSNAAAPASSHQNGFTTQPNSGNRSGSNTGNNGGNRGNGSSGSRRASSSNGGGGSGSSGSGGGGNRNGGSLGSGSSSSSTNGNNNDGSRNTLGNKMHGAGSSSSNGNGDGANRNSGGSGNHWNNNPRNGNGSGNGGGGRGGFRGRRDHDRGGNFSPRNYPRASAMPYQHQQPSVYQPGSFHQPPPAPAHYMVPQHFVPYAPPFAYHGAGDVQSYPFYLPPVEQFQNMNLVRPPMPSWVPQDQSNLAADIKKQIEFYFSTNNLCRDTFLRGHMNDQGWVSINLISTFPKMRAFTSLVDISYILDVIRGSESLEVQGDNVRRRNDWAQWILH